MTNLQQFIKDAELELSEYAKLTGMTKAKEAKAKKLIKADAEESLHMSITDFVDICIALA